MYSQPVSVSQQPVIFVFCTGRAEAKTGTAETETKTSGDGDEKLERKQESAEVSTLRLCPCTRIGQDFLFPSTAGTFTGQVQEKLGVPAWF